MRIDELVNDDDFKNMKAGQYIHGPYLAVSRHYMQMNHFKFKELLYGAK